MIRFILLIILSTLLFSGACVAQHPELKAFPMAEDGTVRYVITLPHKERGDDLGFKVELIPGRVMLTDGINLMRDASTIEARTLQGWGYTFYEVIGRDVAMSTMMATPEGSPQKEAYVAGTPLLIGYNSRLPIVVYAPQGYEVRYRIWSTSETAHSAEVH